MGKQPCIHDTCALFREHCAAICTCFVCALVLTHACSAGRCYIEGSRALLRSPQRCVATCIADTSFPVCTQAHWHKCAVCRNITIPAHREPSKTSRQSHCRQTKRTASKVQYSTGSTTCSERFTMASVVPVTSIPLLEQEVSLGIAGREGTKSESNCGRCAGPSRQQLAAWRSCWCLLAMPSRCKFLHGLHAVLGPGQKHIYTNWVSCGITKLVLGWAVPSVDVSCSFELVGICRVDPCPSLDSQGCRCISLALDKRPGYAQKPA